MFFLLRFPVDKTPEMGLYGVEAVDRGDCMDSRKDRKIKGFPQTVENKLGT